jgi:hypothetical protein
MAQCCSILNCIRFAAALILLAPAMATAQATGTISGLVTDSTDAALPSVALELTNRATGLVRRSTTGPDVSKARRDDDAPDRQRPEHLRGPAFNEAFVRRRRDLNAIALDAGLDTHRLLRQYSFVLERLKSPSASSVVVVSKRMSMLLPRRVSRANTAVRVRAPSISSMT